MPIYKIRDTQTGKVLSVRGDAPPDAQDIDAIFGNQQKTTGGLEGLYNLVARPTVEGVKGYADLVGSAGKTVLGSMLSNGASNNANDAVPEVQAIKEAMARGDTATAKKLAEQSRSRYNTSGQISDKMLSGGQKVLDSATAERQRTGLEGSFDQGLGSGLKTVGIGSLKGAGGVLSALDIYTLGKGSLVKNLAQRGVRNALLNAPLYGVGNIAKDVRETGGENLGQSAWEGVTGSNPIGPVEGITGDTKVAPLADILLSLGLPMTKYGKWSDQVATNVVNAPGRAVQGVKDKYAETKDFMTKAPLGARMEDIPDSAVDVYKSRFVKDTKAINEMGVVDPMDQASRRAIRNGWATTDNRGNIKIVNDSSEELGKMIRGSLRESNEFARTDSILAKTREFMDGEGQATFYNTKYKNAILRQISAIVDAEQAGGVDMAGRVKLDKLYDAEARLGKIQSKFYKAYNRTGDIKNFDTWLAIKLSRDSIKDLIAKAPITSQLLDQNRSPEALARLAKVGGPVLAQDVANAKSIAEIQAIWSDLLELKNNSSYSVKRSARDMKLVTEALRGTAVVAGLSTGNPIMAGLGWLGAPLIQGPLNSAVQRAKGVESNLLTKLSALRRAQ